MRARSIPANAAALVVARLIGAAASIVVAVVAARHLGDHGFGTFAAIIAAGYLANTVITFGSDTLVVRSVAAAASSNDVSASLGMQLCMAAPLVVAGLVGAMLGGSIGVAIGLQTIGLLFGVWSTTASSILRGRRRMDRVTLSIAAGSMISVAGVLVARTASPQVWHFVAAVVAGQAGTALVAVAMVGGDRRHLARPAYERSLWSRSSPFAGMVLASAAITSVGVLALRTLGDASAAGSYAAAHRIVEGLGLVPAAAFGAAFPAMSSSVHREDRYRRANNALLVAIGAAAVVTMVFAEQVVDLVYGDFESASTVIRVLVVGMVPLVSRLRWSYELIAEGHERAVARVTVSTSFATVVAALVLAAMTTAPWVAAATVAGVTAQAATLRWIALANRS